MKRGNWGKRIFVFILLAAAALVVFGGAVMLLWNNILAEVTSVHTITFVQALGILVLSKILFGGFRGGWSGKRHYWKQGMTQKWNSMTPDEREKFKQEWQKRCGWGYNRWTSGTKAAESTQETSETRM